MTISRVDNPLELFRQWFAMARELGLRFPDAMSLATIGLDGFPSVRIVLLKDFDERGFVFFTNSESQKGRELDQNPRAAVCLYWEMLGRQIRIRGTVAKVNDAEADAYFSTRPRSSRIGAWASVQSRPMNARSDFLERIELFEEQFRDKEVPRPPHWTGYRIAPLAYEFWLEAEYRLHHRLEYLRVGDRWESQIVYP